MGRWPIRRSSPRTRRRPSGQQGLLRRWFRATIFEGESENWQLNNSAPFCGPEKGGTYHVNIRSTRTTITPIPPLSLLNALTPLRLRDIYTGAAYQSSRRRLIAPFGLDKDCLYTSTAFSSFLVDRLRALNAAVVVEDRRLYAPDACDADIDVGKRLLARRHEWTRAVMENRRGLIGYSSEEESLAMVRDLAALFPEARVLALCISDAAVPKMESILSASRRREYLVEPEGVESQLYRAHAGSGGWFADYRGWNPDLVVVPRAELLLQEHGQAAFLFNKGFAGRVYGLLDFSVLNNPADLQQLQFYVGDVVFRDGVGGSSWLLAKPVGSALRRRAARDIEAKRTHHRDASLVRSVLDLSQRLARGEAVHIRQLNGGAPETFGPSVSRRRVAVVVETEHLAQIFLQTCSSSEVASRIRHRDPHEAPLHVLTLRDVERQGFDYDVGVGFGVDPRHEPLRSALSEASIGRFRKPDPAESFAFFII